MKQIKKVKEKNLKEDLKKQKLQELLEINSWYEQNFNKKDV